MPVAMKTCPNCEKEGQLSLFCDHGLCINCSDSCEKCLYLRKYAESYEVVSAPEKVFDNDPDTRWIQTYTGRQYFPTNPHPDMICVEDIAHALANICRYTGHCRRFYSVAQHSCWVSDNVHQVTPFNEDPRSPKELKRWGLMHDAAEAYLSDVSGPIKGLLAGYKELEVLNLTVIAGVFGLEMPIPESVKRYDMIALATERRDIMLATDHEWKFLTEQRVEAINTPIVPWTPERAEDEFMVRFRRLFG